MNIREAILRAADSIERNPQLFSFDSVDVPDGHCGSPGCALGWIAHHLGWVETGDVFLNRCAAAIGAPGQVRFYQRMVDIAHGASWMDDAEACASTLRRYADKYHPAAKHTGLPESVLKILEPQLAQMREIIQ